jgi:hypothetical protein
MTPKEKAKELVCKMYGCEIDTDLDDIYILNSEGYFLAKDSALIAVDEILNAAFFATDEIYNFYIEVKQEIEKL